MISFSKKTIPFLFLLLNTFFVIAQTSLPCKEVIGYYPNWQWYDRAKLVRPTTIDYSKYTIINYSFFKPESTGAVSTTDAWADDNLLNGEPNWAQGGYYPNTSIISRAHNAGVKVMVSIGGWSLSDNFPIIAASATKRTTFANACVQLINQYDFDGIDLDWEYPGLAAHGGSAADKQNFTLMLQAIRTALNTRTSQTGKTYLLTSCFGASAYPMNNIEWANVVPLLDCINLMTYDFFGTWDATTNHNSPLYAPAQGDPTFNTNSAINSLINTYNVPANKICAGLAFYGRSHKTNSAPTLHGAGNGTTDAATFSEDDGSPTFFNILRKQNLFNKYTDNQAGVPYLLGKNGLNTFVSYDDTASITAKAIYIKNKNLRGCIIWEMTGDYIETATGSGIIAGTPLVSAIKTAFCNNTTPTCSVPTNITITPSSTSVNASWTNTGAASYEVQYKTATATTWTTLSASANALVINNLTASTAYQIQVKSVCSATLSSAFSAVSNFTTTATATCSVPTNITLTPSSASVNASWISTGVAYYEVQYKTAAATTWTTLSASANAIVINNLTASTAYQIQVKSVCSATLSSAFSAVSSFTTTATTGGGISPCTAPSTFNFTASNYIPMGEIKIGQGRLNPIWGTTVDAYIPSNRKTWAIAMAHAAHLFRNVAKTAKIPASFYFATAAKESFCGCDNTIQAAPATTAFPFSYQAASIGDGCFQIENLSAYTEMARQYPQRFPAGQHANLIGNANFETAALGKAYYDIFTVKYWEVHKNWNPSAFFNTAADPNAAIKLMAIAYNRGLWYPELATVLNTNRSAAITATTISPYFVNNSYGYDYQNALSNYTNILGNNTASLEPTLFNTNPATGQPYNSFNSFYDPQVTWNEVDTYIEKIKVLYPTVNIVTLKSNVQSVFNSINAGNSISFRYNMGQVLDALLLGLPADDPSANIATTYGCGWQAPTNLSPVVSLTQPTQNQAFTSPANVTIAATASDPDGTISKVEFYNGTTLLNTDVTAPYSFVWQNVAAGTYSILAKAYDNLSATTSSTVITISVSTNAPTCTITAPTTATTFILPTDITIDARAIATGSNSVSYVNFYSNGVLLGSVSASPYSFVWKTATVGTWNITATAFAQNNVSTTSSPISITVLAQGSNIPPTCVITQPINNQTFTTPTNITINATATDPNGTVTKVDFYNGTKLLGSDASSPYSFTWLNPAVGTYSITAKATDNQGAVTTSAAVTFIVKANTPPTCAITQPLNNQSFAVPANITINVNATDADGTIAKVDFYRGTTLLGTDATAPYSFAWQNVAIGTYSILAKATDDKGAITSSTTITIVVKANTPPTCSITQPTQNQSFAAPANITINANATDADGTIVKVDFYRGTTLLGTDATAPYSFAWQNVAVGTYSILAKATDDKGAMTSSSVVTITVTAATANTCASQYTAYVEAAPYQVGSVVYNNGGVYSCFVAGWCSGAAWAYSPGLGTAWIDCWTQTGTCSQPLPSCYNVAAYVANTTYQTGAMVKNNANLYLCQIPSWCSGAAGTYEPGVGFAWQQAWVLAGACPNGSSKMISNNQNITSELAYLYPNPTTDKTHLTIPNSPVGQIRTTVFDMTGKLIFTKNTQNEFQVFEDEIDITHLPSGIYSVKIETSAWVKSILLSKE
jgi:GH18 family chitinase